METTHQTSYALCSINCGLEVSVEDNRIVKTRPDKDNPRSQGYACRKGLNIAFHQHNAEVFVDKEKSEEFSFFLIGGE